MKLIIKAFIIFCYCFSLPENGFSNCCDDSPSFVNIGIGAFNVRRGCTDPQFQAEYRSGYRFYEYVFPLAGVMLTTKGSTYFYGGIGLDIPLCFSFRLIPSIAAGIYTKGGGKDLHFPLEFRSAIELAYEFSNQTRLGLQFSHISNASISKHNPGVESLVVSYSIPICK
jgi:hypothetical protein